MWRLATRAYRIWMTFAEAWGGVMTSLLFGACYLVLLAPFRLLSGGFSGRAPRRDTFWIDRPPGEPSLESLRRMG